jgi:hypothetical protein
MVKRRTFKVYMQQYVEQVTEVEVEAANIQEARTLAKDRADKATWTPGDDAYDVSVYGVANEAGELIWER